MGKTIYLINTLQNLQAFFSLTPFLILIGLPVTMFLVSMYNDGVEPRKEIDFFVVLKKKLKLIITILAISVTGAVFIPNEETMYTMLIADKVLTKENYNMTVNEAKKLIDYTVEKIEQVKEEK